MWGREILFCFIYIYIFLLFIKKYIVIKKLPKCDIYYVREEIFYNIEENNGLSLNKRVCFWTNVKVDLAFDRDNKVCMNEM